MTARAPAAADPAELGLFGPMAPAGIPPAGAKSPAVPDTTPKVPAAPRLRPRGARQPLVQDPSATPATATAAVLPTAAAVFRHPAADREIQLHDRVVAYALKRGRRRSIGFLVGAEGLSVHVPKWIGVGDIESALRDKARWILRKLADQQERSQRLAAARIDWRDGTAIPYLGAPLVLHVHPVSAARRGEGPRLVAATGDAGESLHVGLAAGAGAVQLRDAVQRWLKHRAREVFEARCQVFASRIGVECARLRLSSAQTRWGSASADGSIRLNWRLVHFALPLIDYVVAHELAHLREMNHGPRFWAVVRAALPEFESARDALRHGSVPMFD